MDTRKIVEKLKKDDERYNEFLKKWQEAIAKVRAIQKNIGLASFTISNESVDELGFQIFGVNCFMRFKHNLEKGIIEYGVIRRDDRMGDNSWIPFTEIRFDALGNLMEPYKMHSIGEYGDVHLLLIAKHREDLLTAAYGEKETN